MNILRGNIIQRSSHEAGRRKSLKALLLSNQLDYRFATLACQHSTATFAHCDFPAITQEPRCSQSSGSRASAASRGVCAQAPFARRHHQARPIRRSTATLVAPCVRTTFSFLIDVNAGGMDRAGHLAAAGEEEGTDRGLRIHTRHHNVSAPATLSRGAVQRCPLARSPSLTGSVSGSASPATRYGSFPPASDDAKDMLEDILRRKLHHKRRWERSQERLIPGGPGCEDVFDSDADLSDTDHAVPDNTLSPPYQRYEPDGDGDALWNAGDEPSSRSTHPPPRRLRHRDEGPKQWGVQKMELMSMVWGKRGLSLIYAGCVT